MFIICHLTTVTSRYDPNIYHVSLKRVKNAGYQKNATIVDFDKSLYETTLTSKLLWFLSAFMKVDRKYLCWFNQNSDDHISVYFSLTDENLSFFSNLVILSGMTFKESNDDYEELQDNVVYHYPAIRKKKGQEHEYYEVIDSFSVVATPGFSLGCHTLPVQDYETH